MIDMVRLGYKKCIQRNDDDGVNVVSASHYLRT